MREIKFRALKDDISNCNWVYGNLLYGKNQEPRIQESKGVDIYTTCLEGTESQYTGLKDKNGKEIYEGDIFRGLKKATYGIIEFDEEYCCFNVDWYNIKTSEYPTDRIGMDHEETRFYEVIGNIYETPDLLTK